MTLPLVPLPVFGTPHPGDPELLKAAKAALDVPFLVTPVQAVPGGPGRVLALREIPTHLCDYALVANPSNSMSLEAAMRWALTDIEDPRATSLVQMLDAILGPGVRELSDYEIRSEAFTT